MTRDEQIATTRTYRCVECGTDLPDGAGRLVSGHVHRDGRRILASYCIGCESLASLRAQREREGGCEGCFGPWQTRDGEINWSIS